MQVIRSDDGDRLGAGGRGLELPRGPTRTRGEQRGRHESQTNDGNGNGAHVCENNPAQVGESQFTGLAPERASSRLCVSGSDARSHGGDTMRRMRNFFNGWVITLALTAAIGYFAVRHWPSGRHDVSQNTVERDPGSAHE